MHVILLKEMPLQKSKLGLQISLLNVRNYCSFDWHGSFLGQC